MTDATNHCPLCEQHAELQAAAEESARDWHRKHGEVYKTANHWWDQTQHWTEKYEVVAEERDRLREFVREFIGAWDCGCAFVQGNEDCLHCRARALLTEPEVRP